MQFRIMFANYTIQTLTLKAFLERDYLFTAISKNELEKIPAHFLTEIKIRAAQTFVTRVNQIAQTSIADKRVLFFFRSDRIVSHIQNKEMICGLYMLSKASNAVSDTELSAK
jgi:hypothetical protein